MGQLRGASVRYGPPVVVVVFSRHSVQLSVAKLVFRKGIVSRQPASAVAAENIGPPQLSVPILPPPPQKKKTTDRCSSNSFLIFDRFYCECKHSLSLHGAGYSVYNAVKLARHRLPVNWKKPRPGPGSLWPPKNRRRSQQLKVWVFLMRNALRSHSGERCQADLRELCRIFGAGVAFTVPRFTLIHDV